ncbi:MAG: tRNA dihydrouridine synthase DusB [Deltaproteobacteria bacterium]|nr:tRNA dihydrouridine synthase DusB [Deltaproteobacteria bacterium]
MAGVSEAPYRVLALDFGAGLTPTELVSAKGLEFKNNRTAHYLAHDPAREPLLMVQLFGGEPDVMARAAETVVARGARIVDINMGCPVRKVTKSGAGSALMTDPTRAAAIVAAMRARIGARVPITAKIRSGWDDAHRNAVEVGRRLEEAGLTAIAIHPRTREAGYSGRADWREIARLKAALSIPVIANGDIATPRDADRVVRETGCDAVMIGRAALGRPWIFRDFAAAVRGEGAPRPLSASAETDVILTHFEAHQRHRGGDEVHAVREFRQHLIWYSRGRRGHGAFRVEILRETCRAKVESMIERFFRCAEADDDDHEQSGIEYDERRAHG